MDRDEFLMESEQEAIRLDLKTDPQAVREQALWAGLEPDMRVADLGCGAGITTFSLQQLLSPKAEIVGIDFSSQRVQYAQDKYPANGINYVCRDIRAPLDDLGGFDFIWIRFVLEYYRSNSLDILRNAVRILNPGGIMCLIDLDHNCLNHYGLPQRLINSIFGIINKLQENSNFDPYVGRKLYSYLYDLGFFEIRAKVDSHHLFYGDLPENQIFNNVKKLEVAGKNSEYGFEEYNGDYSLFLKEFKTAFFHPRRFSYTPIICCCGRKSEGTNYI